MNNFLQYLIPSIITVTTQLYATGILIKRKMNFKEFRTYFIIFIASLIVAILFSLSDNFIRVILTISFLMMTNCYLYREDWLKTLFSVFVIIFLYAIGDILFTLIVITILDLDITTYGNRFFGSLLANFSISCIVIAPLRIPLIKQKLQKIIHMSTNKSTVILISILGTIVFIFSLYSAYFKLDSLELLFIMMLYIIIYMFIVFQLIHEKRIKEIVENKNNLLVENIVEYEKIIELQKIESHENKNQLRIIKQMISEDNKELQEYVNTVLKEQGKKDKHLLYRVQNIPNGGLRALIYAKLVNLPKNYNMNLIISRSINTKVLNSIPSATNVDMCKILGVFLDNAIEAAAETKEKIVGVELYVENKQMYISISNSFLDYVDMEKMDEPKFSTKGINRGYGLTLVKEIINSNKSIINKRKINNNIFVQTLIIKLK